MLLTRKSGRKQSPQNKKKYDNISYCTDKLTMLGYYNWFTKHMFISIKIRIKAKKYYLSHVTFDKHHVSFLQQIC